MNRAPFTEALKQLLLDETDIPGDVGRSPRGLPAPTDSGYRYWVLHPVPGGGHTGPAQRPEADARLAYQVTSVGRRADQIEHVADRVRATILARLPNGQQRGVTADGIATMWVEVESLGGIEFDGDIGNLAELYTFYATTT